MLKGIPDSPTPQNLPGVPIDISLANWWGLDSCFCQKAGLCGRCTSLFVLGRHRSMCMHAPAPPLSPRPAHPTHPLSLQER